MMSVTISGIFRSSDAFNLFYWISPRSIVPSNQMGQTTRTNLLSIHNIHDNFTLIAYLGITA